MGFPFGESQDQIRAENATRASPRQRLDSPVGVPT